MPPKVNKKTEEKKKDKIIEDKTFGLKNKNKSKTVQQYIKTVAQQVKGAQSKSERALLEAKKQQQDAKKKEEETNALLQSLFKAAVTIKQVQPKAGEDPKSIVCAFFREGKCQKGDKCKFSHDLNADRKSAKIDLYSDKRDQDDMETWDQSKLESVISSKHDSENKNRPTDIICKFFLEAVEKKQYGWFWECPNGPTCKYRHALPPGYVLRTEAKKVDPEDEEEPLSLEEQIEEERARLPPGGTPVNAETFAQWKEDKARKKAEQMEADRKAEAKKTGGRGLNVMSGRDLFTFDPSLFVDDEEAVDADDYEVHEEEEGEEGEEGDSENQGHYPRDGEDAGESAGPIQENLFVGDDTVLEDLDDLDLEDDEEEESKEDN